jgi:hypothetical protein
MRKIFKVLWSLASLVVLISSSGVAYGNPNEVDQVSSESKSLAVARDISDLLDVHTFTLSPADKSNLGFVSVSYIAETDQLKLTWKGDPSPEVLQVADSVKSHLVVEQGKFSFYELQDAIQSVTNSKSTYETLVGKFGLNVLTPKDDGSGIKAQFSKSESEVDLDILQAALDKVTHVPFEFEFDSSFTLTASRASDVSPFNGGSFIEKGSSSSGLICSLGFPVTNASGVDYLLTARHCFDGFGSAANVYPYNLSGRLGVWTSATALNNATRDLELVKPDSGVVSARVYLGAYNTTSTSLNYGALPNVSGQDVCTNGGNSGRHCYVNTDAVCVTITLMNGQAISCVNHGAAISPQTWVNYGGDSGGPVVLQSNAPITGAMYSLGTIIGSKITTARTGNVNATTTDDKAFSDVYWTDLKSGLTSLGVTLAN